MSASSRIAILGAGSLRGRQLNDVLADSAFAGSDFLLMDDEEELGKLESIGDEVTFIQRITPDSFAGVDFAFFAGAPDLTRRHWRSAEQAGASIVDLSYGLEGEAGVPVRAPWISSPPVSLPGSSSRIRSSIGGGREAETTERAQEPGLHTSAVVSAHPAALSLALLARGLQGAGSVRRIVATVLEPSSEYGRAAMDELHRQTVGLLSFQTVPREVYGLQVAFNAVTAAGEESKVDLGESEERIRRHYAQLSAGALPGLSLQLVHAPVFHGHAFSVAAEYESEVSLERVEASLAGAHIEIVREEEDAPSNLTAAGQENLLVRLRLDERNAVRSRTLQIWAASDNLRIAAANAVACAGELGRLRPRGEVQ